VPLDAAACGPILANKRVLITGGAGSIGAELARQVLVFHPESVLAVDMNETGLYELERELGSARLRTSIADVADARRMRDLFLQARPHVVFHAAAYKHVPLVEANPDQGFITNVLGTLAVCEAAVVSGAERVVVISTDKAVNPSSFMGLTKRVAELVVAAMTQTASSTVLSAVRFGNVLGSRGSIVPILLRQIESGGPLTITHPDVQRFFMTLAEAAQLVLVACTFGGPGGLYVLDMGEEVRIQQLAERLVRLKGLRPRRDLAIEYIGLRPGEKLREELHTADERLVPTEHAMVWRVAASYRVDAGAVFAAVRELEAQRQAGELQPSDYPSRLRMVLDTAIEASNAVASPLTSR
jgi:FlaA1/EpsC-like NDP-sugar epimerase